MKVLNYITKNLTVPNALSVMRLFLIIPFVISFLAGDYITSVSLMVISGITDAADGIIARKFGQTTDLGKMLDPTADKITLMAVMICFGMKFPTIFPFMIILISKEVLMIIAGIFLLSFKINPPPAKWYGKIATVMFYISIITIMGVKAIFGYESEALNSFFMYITLICMLYAIIMYFKIFLSKIKNIKISK